jgi:hypothetical protein
MTIAVGVDSYASIAEADDYHGRRGNADWTGAATAAKEAALLRATAYLDGRYRWIGQVATLTQPLSWPRAGAIDGEGRALFGIPAHLRDACCELARTALGAELTPAQPRGGMVTGESVGPVSVNYAAGAPAGTTYPAVDLLLRGLVLGDGVVALVRS